MKTNLASIERPLRIIIGIAALALGVVFHSWWGALGAVPLLTGLINWCPAYALFGVSTCKIKTNSV